MQSHLTDAQVKDVVQRGYTQAVTQSTACCTPSISPDSCCTPNTSLVNLQAKRTRLTEVVGYDASDLARLPETVVASAFGCGNPLAFTEVQPGEVVLDIGSGAGIDCLLAAEKVGPSGRVIGLDMTPAMIAKATEHAQQAGVTNVEFRMGDAEQMPVEDASVNWVISNCVINLAPNKVKVFQEVARALRPGGRVSISDIVLGEDLPQAVAEDIDALLGCVAGAVKESDYLDAMRAAGLTDLKVESRFVYGAEHLRGFFSSGAARRQGESAIPTLFETHRERIIGQIWSARITARKPLV